MKNLFGTQCVLIVLGLMLSFASHVQAETYEELVDYFVLDDKPLSQSGDIVVEEAFWYGCPHCNALHPHIKIWLKRKPQDVSFRFFAIPGATENNSWTTHAKLYYALELLTKKDPAKLNQLHDSVFHAIHTNKKSMLTVSEIARVTSAFGISQDQLTKTMNSFPVRLEIDRARKKAQTYQISGVPALIVNGKYMVTNVSARGNTRMMRILNYLIDRARKDMTK